MPNTVTNCRVSLFFSVLLLEPYWGWCLWFYKKELKENILIISHLRLRGCLEFKPRCLSAFGKRRSQLHALKEVEEEHPLQHWFLTGGSKPCVKWLRYFSTSPYCITLSSCPKQAFIIRFLVPSFSLSWGGLGNSISALLTAPSCAFLPGMIEVVCIT